MTRLMTSDAAEIPTVMQKPSQRRTRYWAMKSKFSAMPAAASEAHTTATTTTLTAR